MWLKNTLLFEPWIDIHGYKNVAAMLLRIFKLIPYVSNTLKISDT